MLLVFYLPGITWSWFQKPTSSLLCRQYGHPSHQFPEKRPSKIKSWQIFFPTRNSFRLKGTCCAKCKAFTVYANSVDEMSDHLYYFKMFLAQHLENWTSGKSWLHKTNVALYISTNRVGILFQLWNKRLSYMCDFWEILFMGFSATHSIYTTTNNQLY